FPGSRGPPAILRAIQPALASPATQSDPAARPCSRAEDPWESVRDAPLPPGDAVAQKAACRPERRSGYARQDLRWSPRRFSRAFRLQEKEKTGAGKDSEPGRQRSAEPCACA